jgi:predicted enzyme related to lactoylglutathione lyase
MDSLQGTYGWCRILVDTHCNHKKGVLQKPEVNGGLFQKQLQQQGVTQLNYITVEAIDEYTEKVRKLGGKMLVS